MAGHEPLDERFGERLGASLSDMRGLAAGFADEVHSATRAMQRMDRQAVGLSRSLSSSLRSAFDRAVFGGAKLGDVFRDLAGSIAGRSLNAALKPLTNAISGGIGGLFTNLVGSATSALGFAHGSAFSAGRVRAFAQGGVVGGPTLFPMRSGTGLMGEAGPEAIMPLTRGPDGRLGVTARGTGQAAPVVVNIATPDVEGFRRSRGQIAAQLARAVRRGQAQL